MFKVSKSLVMCVFSSLMVRLVVKFAFFKNKQSVGCVVVDMYGAIFPQ